MPMINNILRRIILIALVIGISACSSESNVPEGEYWEINIDGLYSYSGTSVVLQYTSGKLILMGMSGPVGSSVILQIPIPEKDSTGVFSDAITLSLPGIPDKGPCGDKEAIVGEMTADISENRRQLLSIDFRFEGIPCVNDGTTVSGTGRISRRVAL